MNKNCRSILLCMGVMVISSLWVATSFAQERVFRPANPGVPPVGTQPPGTMQPVMQPGPGQLPPQQFEPRIATCAAADGTALPFVMDLNLVATPVDPFSLQLSWSGPAGTYRVTGPGFNVDVSSGASIVTSSPNPTLQPSPGRISGGGMVAGSQPATVELKFPFSRPQYPVLPDTNYGFEVRTTLPDSRVVCDAAGGKTPPATITALPSTFVSPDEIRLGFELPPFVQELNIYREAYTDGKAPPAPRILLREPLVQSDKRLRYELRTKDKSVFDNRKIVNPGLPPLPANYSQPPVYMLTVEGVWRDASGNPTATRTTIPVNGPMPLWGWADLHTHPMSNLAFGGKVFHGAPDGQSLLPARSIPAKDSLGRDDCVVARNLRATSILDALGSDSPTHGDPLQSVCGDAIRKALIVGLEMANGANMPQPGRRMGAPVFDAWPAWHDISHQKMWVDWLRRAYDGGLRVMVGLSHNNRLLADIARGNCSNPDNCWIPGDDLQSSDVQIMEMKEFVRRNSSFMEVALNPADVYRIVRGNPARKIPSKLAVVLGIEIDNIGNFCIEPLPPEQLKSGRCRQASEQAIRSELTRLHSQGVRYIFPVHVTNNLFGGAAPYEEIFNAANLVETGEFWKFECAGTVPAPNDDIGFTVTDFSAVNQALAWFSDATRLPGANASPLPRQIPVPTGASGCAHGFRNQRGLSGQGSWAIREMMKMGFIIDVDHMSHHTVERVLGLAESVPDGGYPLMSGHSGIRDRGDHHRNAENSRTRSQLDRIGCLGGMFGLGTSAADARDWANQYRDALSVVRHRSPGCLNKELGLGAIALGTDVNSMVKSPKPLLESNDQMDPIRNLDIYASQFNSRFPSSRAPLNPAVPNGPSWDLRTNGVVHYGMFADFLKAVWTLEAPRGSALTGRDLIEGHLERNADNFWRMWVKVDQQKGKVK